MIILDYNTDMKTGSWLDKIYSLVNPSNQHRFFSGIQSSKQHSESFIYSGVQKDLSEQMKELADIFNRRLAEIDEAILNSSDRNLKQQKKIKKSQHLLQKALFQFKAALQSTPLLKQEVIDWERYLQDESPIDLFHPAVRHKLIKAELDLRDILENGKISENISVNVIQNEPAKQLVAPENLEQTQEVATPAVSIRHQFSNSPHLKHEPEYLIRNIRDIYHEINVHCESPHMDSKEVLIFVHQLKEMHGLLKKVDRQNNILRDRVSIADM